MKRSKTQEIKSLSNIFPEKMSLFILFLLTVMVYSGVFAASFLNWDDTAYVTENVFLRSLSFENFKHLLSDNFVGNFHPVTMISLALDYAIVGPQAWYFHGMNLLFHLLASWIVYLFFKRLLNQFQVPVASDVALILAALFALHPMHVESVAWISERKDVLYSLFFWLSLLFWLKKDESNIQRNYGLALFFFILSLLSKAQAVALVPVIVALDFFKGKFKVQIRKIPGYIPFLLLAAVIGWFAIQAQHNENALGIGSQKNIAYWERIILAAWAYTMYHIKLLIPYNLSAIVPYPVKFENHFAWYYYVLALPAPVSLWAIFKFRKKYVLFSLGLIFFLLNILLLLQLIPVGSAIMADRYTYIASSGFFLALLALFIPKLKNRKKYKRFVYLATAYLVVLSYMSFQRTKAWNNSMALWNDVIEKYDHVQLAYNNRGNLFFERNQYDQALQDYKKAVDLDETRPESYNNLGTVYESLKKYDASIEAYSKAIALDPNYPKAWYGRGSTYLSKKQYDAAIQDLNKAIRINPSYAEAYANRANALLNLGKVNPAMDDFNRAIKLQPYKAENYSNRGIARVVLGDFEGAISDYSQCVKLNPNDALAYYLRGMAWFSLKQYEKACSDFTISDKLGFAAAKQKAQQLCGK